MYIFFPTNKVHPFTMTSPVPVLNYREQPLPDPVPIHESVWAFMEKKFPEAYVKALRVAVDQAHTTHQQVHDFDCPDVGVFVRTCYGASPVRRQYYTGTPEDRLNPMTTWKDLVIIRDKRWFVKLHAPTGRIETLDIYPDPEESKTPVKETSTVNN